LAHALGIRLRINVHGDTDHIEHLGPTHAPVIAVHHTGNHYDASTPVAPPKRTHLDDDRPTTGKRRRTTPSAGEQADPTRTSPTVMPAIDWNDSFAPQPTVQQARQIFQSLTRHNPTPPRPTPAPTGSGTAPRSAGTPETSLALAFVYGSTPDTLEDTAGTVWYGQDIPTTAEVHHLLMTHEDAYRTDYQRFHAQLADPTDPRPTEDLIDDFAHRYHLNPATVAYWATHVLSAEKRSD
ncbi:hypothetical protein, partial [Kitasatospora sp. NPDC002522]